MGLLSRSTTFVRYEVEGNLPENFWDFAAQRISEFSFRDIDDTFDEYSIGWVSIENMFDSSFAYGAYAVGDYIVLSLRIDERKVSKHPEGVVVTGGTAGSTGSAPTLSPTAIQPVRTACCSRLPLP